MCQKVVEVGGTEVSSHPTIMCCASMHQYVQRCLTKKEFEGSGRFVWFLPGVNFSTKPTYMYALFATNRSMEGSI